MGDYTGKVLRQLRGRKNTKKGKPEILTITLFYLYTSPLQIKLQPVPIEFLHVFHDIHHA